MSKLQGCVVLDLGIITAGAATSALLGDLGAEVIKIESPTYRDPFRTWSSTPAPGEAADLPPFFRMTNRNKRSVSINLKQAAGREVFLRLARRCDVVVENFSRGVLQRLQIDYPTLRAANPGIILASISSQGDTGPEARYVSFGSTLEAVAGLASGTGYAGGGPVVSGRDLNYPDQVVAIFAAGMISAALLARSRGQGGAHLDMSQRELTSFLCGERFVAAGEDAPRAGNQQAPYAVQDCFRCSDGRWIALSIGDGDLAALGVMLGDGMAPSASSSASSLAAWIRQRTSEACIALLRAAGLCAAPVQDAAQVLRAMGQDWRMAMQLLPDGQVVKGFPFQFATAPMAITREATTLGTDTEDVLTRLGGYSADEIDRLVRDDVVQRAAARPVSA